MQLQTSLPAPSLIHLEYLVASDVQITLVVRTRQPEVACPGCGRTTARVQSRYRRTVADLPWLAQRGAPARSDRPPHQRGDRPEMLAAADPIWTLRDGRLAG